MCKCLNIAKGNSLFILNSLLLLPKEKYTFANERLAICRKCEESTWLCILEYLYAIRTFPPKVLSKKPYTKNSKLFCRICKCWLPAKTYVKTEQCPLNKWSNENG